MLFLYNDAIEPNIAFLSSPSIINEQRELLGWNLITFGREGIQDIFKMILIERFRSKNTKTLLDPNYNSIFLLQPKRFFPNDSKDFENKNMTSRLWIF